MPIVPSRSRQIQELVAALAAASAAERESAEARLRLLGARAVLPLVAALQASDPATRKGALHVLERLEDARARSAVLGAAADPDASVAHAAVVALARRTDADAVRAEERALRHADASVRREAARGLAAAFAAGSVEATESVLSLLEDREAEEGLRLIALEAVARLPDGERRGVLRRLGTLEGELARRVAALRGEAPPQVRLLAEIALEVDAAPAGPESVPRLHDALRRLAALPAGEAWALRLRVHRELVARESRIALYDLREMLEQRPAGDAEAVLDLVGRIGDASFVPALARLAHEAPAHTAACVEALAALLHRERFKKTHRAVKAVRPEHRAELDGLWARAEKRR